MTQLIEHVFVLMLENRSFDHMLGFSGIKGTDAETGQPTAVRGLGGTESNFYNGKAYAVSQPADWQMPVDPGHEFTDVLTQLCGPGAAYQSGGMYPPISNSGYVADYASSGGASNPAEITCRMEPSPQLIIWPPRLALSCSTAAATRWMRRSLPPQ